MRIKIRGEYSGHGYSGTNGLYVHAKLDAITRTRLTEICEQLGCAVEDNLHITVCYSKHSVPVQSLNFDNVTYEGVCNEILAWDDHKKRKMVVAIVHAPELIVRNADYVANGAVLTFTPYKPHISLSYDTADITNLDDRIKAINEALALEPIQCKMTMQWPEDLK